MSPKKNRTPDLFAPKPVARMVSARHAPEDGPWQGPGTDPHDYHPDIQAMGDCTVCGHTYGAHLIHDPEEPLSAPGR